MVIVMVVLFGITVFILSPSQENQIEKLQNQTAQLNKTVNHFLNVSGYDYNLKGGIASVGN